MCDKFLSVFSFASRIPVPLKYKFDMSRIDLYLPVIGALASMVITAAVFAVYFLTQSGLLAVVFAVLAQYLCFNLFHLDGLADTADAFLGTADKEKTLLILKDSRIGVYGLFAAVMMLIIKICLLYTLLENRFTVLSASLLCISFPIAGRFAALLIPRLVPPAKPDGLGALSKDSRIRYGICGIMIAFAVLFLFSVLMEFIVNGSYSIRYLAGMLVFSAANCLASGVLTALFYARMYKKRLGGYTGDALGAAIETGEALALLCCVVLRHLMGG